MLRLLALALALALTVPAAAHAQDVTSSTDVISGPSYPAPDDDLVREVPRTRRAIEAEIARLREITVSIDSDASEFAAGMGAQMMIYGILFTILGGIVEAIAQSLSSSPYSSPPWIFLAVGGVGGGLAAIGVPLFTVALCDPGYRRDGRASRRIFQLRQELFGVPEEPSAPAVSLAPVLREGLAGLSLTATF